jgi:amidase
MFINKEKSKTTFSCDFSENDCAGIIESGSIVTFETNDDVYYKLSKGEKFDNNTNFKIENINRVTGPLYIKNSDVGDSLEIEIINIEIKRCWSVWTDDVKISGCLASKRAAFGNGSSVRELKIDSNNQEIIISDRMKLPLLPMIGCIATAPKYHTLNDCTYGCGCSTFEPTYPTGGNMDIHELQKGTKITIKVENKGAGLYIGDLHASMARGEVTWVGFEGAGLATVKVNLIKGKFPLYPIIKLNDNNDLLFTCVSSNKYLDAAQMVLSFAFDYLIKDIGLTGEEAHAFLTAMCDIRFGGPASKQVLIHVPSPLKYI